MAPQRTTQRRRWWMLGLAVLAVVLVVGASGSWVLWRHFHQGQRMSTQQGQRMSIPGTVGSPSEPTPAPSTQVRPEGPPFVTSVSPSGRYFLDQYGRPLLLHGDSPWALMTLLSPQQARLWFADRQTQGFNAAIISLIGAKANGAPSDDGATFDGLLPFVDGDVLQWQEPYWERVTTYLRMAAEHGITAESTRRTYQSRLDRELNAIMVLAPTNQHGKRLRKRFGKIRGHLFTFLEHPEVPPDNNGSEGNCDPQPHTAKFPSDSVPSGGPICLPAFDPSLVPRLDKERVHIRLFSQS